MIIIAYASYYIASSESSFHLAQFWHIQLAQIHQDRTKPARNVLLLKENIFNVGSQIKQGGSTHMTTNITSVGRDWNRSLQQSL